MMKFGGTSLGDAERLQRVGDIVAQACAAGEAVAVVASAHAGVTNSLFAAANEALKACGDDSAATRLIAPIRKRHVDIAEGLGVPSDICDELLSRLEGLLRGIIMLGELSPRSLDHAASFGERMSCRILAASLQKRGLPARAFDAWELGLTTDRRFGQARPLPQADAAIGQAFDRLRAEGVLPIITGYIGHAEDGAITTLGRNGSDYSAAIFGAGACAREIQIWTDVPGILTTDPRVVTQAQIIHEMSFDEAAELANYGAKVIHPATLTPAVEKNIPIRVKSTWEPEADGSVIVTERRRSPQVAKAIAHKDGITLVHIHSTKMLGRPGFLSKIAKVFQICDIDVDMIATSEVSVSLTIEDDRHLASAVSRLSRFADVQITRERAIVCVVGEGLSESPATLARVFEALAQLGVAPDLISQGASRLNLGMVVPQSRSREVVQFLHGALFPASAH